MSKKKQPEDNRDIFEKIMDSVPTLAGAYLGGKAGNRVGREFIKAGSSKQWKKAADELGRAGRHSAASDIRSTNFSANVVASPFTAGGAAIGGFAGSRITPFKDKYKKRRK